MMKDHTHHMIAYAGLGGLYFKHYIWPVIEKFVLKRVEKTEALEEERIIEIVERWHHDKNKRKRR